MRSRSGFAWIPHSRLWATTKGLRNLAFLLQARSLFYTDKTYENLRIFMMTRNLNEINVLEEELILDIILVFRNRNNDDEASIERMPRWTVTLVEGEETIQISGDLGIVTSALVERFRDLAANSVSQPVRINLQQIRS